MIDIYELYLNVIGEYEKIISEYTYTCHFISKNERVYVIQDSFVVYLGVINFSPHKNSFDYRVVFEELLENSIFKFNFSGFSRKFLQDEQIRLLYKRFQGTWDQPIMPNRGTYYDPIPAIPSRRSIVNFAIPKLRLRERYESYDGNLYNFIVYELIDDGKTGYAIYISNNPAVHKIAREKANEVEWCGLSYYATWSKNPQIESVGSILYPNGYEHLASCVHCDKIMLENLARRVEVAKATKWEQKYSKNAGANKLCLAEFDLKYFWISQRAKTKQQAFDIAEDIFRRVHDGEYKDIPRYEYIISGNKWKSEQLVYEIAKKIYGKSRVLYQYRPFFLKTDHGQMSYDVFICGLNVAIEYQGKQHFEPVDIFGGEQHYNKQVLRDKLKKSLSIANGVALTYVNYWEDISSELIEKRVKQALMNATETEE